MDGLKRWLKDFFGFSRAQVNGFIVLIPFLALVLFSAPAYHWYRSAQGVDNRSNRARLDSLITIWEEPQPGAEVLPKRRTAGEPAGRTAFLFDPNKTSVRDFQRLGFSKRIADRIVRYREKGGKFRMKADLLKIYGMDSTLYRKLYGFVDLPEEEAKEEKKERPLVSPLRNARPMAKFDINRADSSDLRKIYGIGDRLAVRILRYREALGGFVGLEQVREVFGLDSAVVARLMEVSYVDDDFIPIRLNINQADERTLAIHPYLRKSAARAIVTYRFQHGGFTAITDLGKIHALDDETIQKIAPYLIVEDPAGGEREYEQRN